VAIVVRYQRSTFWTQLRTRSSRNFGLRLEGQFTLQSMHRGQWDADNPRSAGTASDSFNHKAITVRERIRNQVEIFAIQPYVPCASISEFSQFLTKGTLFVMLSGHGTTPLLLLVDGSDLRC
jgi:hypothetical protein